MSAVDANDIVLGALASFTFEKDLECSLIDAQFEAKSKQQESVSQKQCQKIKLKAFREQLCRRVSDRVREKRLIAIEEARSADKKFARLYVDTPLEKTHCVQTPTTAQKRKNVLSKYYTNIFNGEEYPLQQQIQRSLQQDMQWRSIMMQSTTIKRHHILSQTSEVDTPYVTSHQNPKERLQVQLDSKQRANMYAKVRRQFMSQERKNIENMKNVALPKARRASNSRDKTVSLPTSCLFQPRSTLSTVDITGEEDILVRREINSSIAKPWRQNTMFTHLR